MMLGAEFAAGTGFRPHDVLVFGDLLQEEILAALQMPASVGFRLHEPAYWLLNDFTADQLKLLSDQPGDNRPLVRADMLIIPLAGNDSVPVDAVIHGLDPGLLAKMDPEWMVELQQELLQRFARRRREFVEPVTGLYNQWALERLLPGTTCWKSLFLIATVSRARTISAGFQKTVQLASLLEVITRDPLFYFGQGVFGHVSLQCDRRAALQFSHRLISRLKRENLRRIHIGFACMDDEQTGEQTFEDCRRALYQAEKRGPYSLCDAGDLKEGSTHPLALPEARVLKKLQRAWRGLDRFGLVLIEQDGEEAADPVDTVAAFPEDSVAVQAAEGCWYILLPRYSSVQTADQTRIVAEKMEKSGKNSPAMGSCHWPSTASSRTDCIRNCRKAILHGSFYGTGAVVAFDALSLNVSGDHFFDEGDYKQAIREYRAGLAMKPGDINLLNSLGVALAEVNRHRQAIDCFSRVLELKPGNHMALVNKAMSCRCLGRDEEALQCFEWALQSMDRPEQGSLEICFQLARLYCGRKQFNHAARLLASWRDEHGTPEEFLFFKLLGEAYLGMGRNREAIEALQHSLQLHPRNSDSLSMLGYLYIVEGEGLELGLSLCDRAIDMDGGEVENYYRKAAALYHAGEDDRALAVVRQALQRRKKHEGSLLLRARIYERLGIVHRARMSYEQFLKHTAARGGQAREIREHLEGLRAAG